METKSCELSIKKVSEGKVVATLARLGVRDRDGDILTPGLLQGRQLVAIKPQHKWDHVDLGVADTYENGNTMEASMEFNMAIPAARDWFEAIRFSHEKNRRQQYSFGFEVMDFESGAHEGKPVRFLKHIAMAEVSPVLIGASIGSQTLTVKEYRRALWPGGVGVTNSLGAKEHIGEAVTSMRSGRRHMQRVCRLMDEEKSAAKSMRINEYMDAATDEFDTAMEHVESALDLIESIETSALVTLPVTDEKTGQSEVPREILVVDAKQEGWEVQSLVFPKSKWDSADECRTWAKDHDFTAEDVDETESSFRFRQADPEAFTRLRTICLAPNRDTAPEDCRVQAVGGPRKESRSDDSGEEKEQTPESFQGLVDDAITRFDHVVGRLERFKLVRESEGRSLQPSRLEQARSLVQRLHALEEVVKQPETDPADHGAAAALFDQFRSNHLQSPL